MVVRMPSEMYDRIRSLADAENRACSAVLRAAVDAGLKELEWQNDLIAYAKSVRAGTVKTTQLDDLMVEFEISDPADAAKYLDEIQ